MSKQDYKKYWFKNLQYLSILLSLWFLSSFGCAILFADYLDQFQFGGFKLGFWFAQQGSISIFVLIILAYIFLMNRLDRKYKVEETEQDRF